MSADTSRTLTNPFLGSISEVCIVTPDSKKTIDGLTKLGIGPFQIFHFNPSTVQSRFFRGQSSDFELYACFAKQEYLSRHGDQEGIQHIAFDMGDIPMTERIENMKERGFEPAMQGEWLGEKGTCSFCFFDTKGATGTVFETIEFSVDWKDPECEWYPAPPTNEETVGKTA